MMLNLYHLVIKQQHVVEVLHLTLIPSFSQLIRFRQSHHRTL